jgi:hypothetical protein
MNYGTIRYAGRNPATISSGEVVLNFQADSKAQTVQVGTIVALLNEELGIGFRARLLSSFGENTRLDVFEVKPITINRGTILGVIPYPLPEISGTLLSKLEHPRGKYVLVMGSHSVQLYERKGEGRYVKTSQDGMFFFLDSKTNILFMVMDRQIFPRVGKITCQIPLIPNQSMFIKDDSISRKFDEMLVFDSQSGLKVFGRKSQIEGQTTIDISRPVSLSPGKTYFAIAS